MTHTEKVHVIFGAMAALSGLFALWSAYRPGSWTRVAWPTITFLIGFFLFIPVEAHTRTYQEMGWWDALRSVVPDNAAHWFSNWFRYLAHWHVVQHKIGSGLIMAAGVIEFFRSRGRLGGRVWGWALPLLLLGIALAFGVHGGTAEHLPHPTEQLHHKLLGLAFAAAAIVLALVRAGRLQGPGWQGCWALLVIAVGLDIALLYRLTPEERVRGGHHHESTGPGMR